MPKRRGIRLSASAIKNAAIVAAGGLLAVLMYPEEPPMQATQAIHQDRMTVPAADKMEQAGFALPSVKDPAPARVKLFELDKNGALLVDNGSKVRLEMLVSQLPANMSVRDLERFAAEVSAGLPPAEASRAATIVRAYVAYVKAKDELDAKLGAAGPVHNDGQALTALRREIFGTEMATALFSFEEAQTSHGARIAALRADANLSARQKLDRIEQLRTALPPEMAAAEANALEAAKAEIRFGERIAALRRSGAAESEIQRAREHEYGVQGAQDIATMERQKNDWERRYQEYAREKNLVLASPDTGRQKQERIEFLLRRHYLDQEVDFARAFDQGRSVR